MESSVEETWTPRAITEALESIADDFFFLDNPHMSTASGDVPPKRTCFVISPIGKDGSDSRKAADQVLKHLIRKALGDEFEILRSDEDSNPGSITSQIIESILEADLIVADLSTYNPNVYYEVAVAHGYEKPTVHIQRSDEKPAFDLKDMRLVLYNMSDPDEVEQAQKKLSESARFVLANPTKARTPLSEARRFLQIADSSDPVAQSNAAIIDQLRLLRSEVRRALPRTRLTPRLGADISGIRTVVERAAERQALIADDFDSIITTHTSSSFDEWARRVLARVTGEDDPGLLNEVLFEEVLLEEQVILDGPDDEKA